MLKILPRLHASSTTTTLLGTSEKLPEMRRTKAFTKSETISGSILADTLTSAPSILKLRAQLKPSLWSRIRKLVHSTHLLTLPILALLNKTREASNILSSQKQLVLTRKMPPSHSATLSSVMRTSAPAGKLKFCNLKLKIHAIQQSLLLMLQGALLST